MIEIKLLQLGVFLLCVAASFMVLILTVMLQSMTLTEEEQVAMSKASYEAIYGDLDGW